MQGIIDDLIFLYKESRCCPSYTRNLEDQNEEAYWVPTTAEFWWLGRGDSQSTSLTNLSQYMKPCRTMVIIKVINNESRRSAAPQITNLQSSFW